MTVPPINVDDLVAIDVHTHAEVSSRGQGSLSAELTAASSTYFKVDGERRRPTLTEIAAYYRERRVVAKVLPGVAGPVRQHAADGQDALRFGLPFTRTGPVVG